MCLGVSLQEVGEKKRNDYLFFFTTHIRCCFYLLIPGNVVFSYGRPLIFCVEGGGQEGGTAQSKRAFFDRFTHHTLLCSFVYRKAKNL